MTEPSPYIIGQILYRATVLNSCVLYEKITVARLTPKGAWVTGEWSWRWDERWVGYDAKFASVTKDLALDRLQARKSSYVRHCRRRLKNAETQLSVATDGREPEPLKLGWFREGL